MMDIFPLLRTRRLTRPRYLSPTRFKTLLFILPTAFIFGHH